jgi:hypothetical protein
MKKAAATVSAMRRAAASETLLMGTVDPRPQLPVNDDSRPPFAFPC